MIKATYRVCYYEQTEGGMDTGSLSSDGFIVTNSWMRETRTESIVDTLEDAVKLLELAETNHGGWDWIIEVVNIIK